MVEPHNTTKSIMFLINFQFIMASHLFTSSAD